METIEKPPLLIASAGSGRYEYAEGSSDLDVMVLWTGEDKYSNNLETRTDFFFTSLGTFCHRWGHPLLLGNLTGECTGNERLCAFLREHLSEIPYAAPTRTVLFGLNYIAQGERAGYNSTLKPGLRTAMILSHMAMHIEDPFVLSDEEKVILLRARTGGVLPEERMEIYRRTISPENINRLMKMPNHPTIKNELFTLLEEVISC